MRQILALVPEGKGDAALALAKDNHGKNLVAVSGKGVEGARDLVVLQVPTNRVDAVVGGLQEIGEAHITLIPQGVIPLFPPASEAPEQTTDVSNRSPLEIFVSGLQSIGSWTGFLGYAFCAGIVVWTALFTNTIYLLTAAMLIAPFAGPAMTLALGTARGDWELARRSVLRYFSSLLVCIATAWALNMLFGHGVATSQMVENSIISAVSVMLPLAAGAAGALNLCQSERSSLVTAAGPGALVAASLAPPAGVIGMAAAIGRWDMMQSAVYVLLLQLVAINASGAVIFALFGLAPRGVRYDRGRRWIRYATYAVTIGALAALLTWQFWSLPNLQRSSVSKRISEEIHEAVDQSQLAKLIEANSRFTRADIEGQNSVLAVVYVQKADGVKLSDGEVKDELTRRITERINARDFNVTPLVDVTVFPAKG